jgi:hypothetical protein
MANDVFIPNDLKGGPAAIFKEQNIQTEELGAGIDGVGFSLIGFKGREFYIRHQGKRSTLLDETGRAARHFDFVILQKGAGKSHTWYKDAYVPGSDKSPDCVSTDGVAPDDSSPNPQSELCGLCPRYEWKLQRNGRKGRECQDSLRLAVLPMPSQIKLSIGEAITEPVLFRIPAASLKGFSDFGRAMQEKFGGNAPFCSYIMRVTFKEGIDHPQLEYRLLDWLSDDNSKLIIEMRNTTTAWRILGLTPEGNSLVRRQAVDVTPVVAQIAQAARGEPFHHQNQSGVTMVQVGEETQLAQQLAAERARRIEAVRAQAQKPVQGQLAAGAVLELRPDEFKQAFDGVEGNQGNQSEPGPAQQPVLDAAADMDALVAAMRPRPPGA